MLSLGAELPLRAGRPILRPQPHLLISLNLIFIYDNTKSISRNFFAAVVSTLHLVSMLMDPTQAIDEALGGRARETKSLGVSTHLLDHLSTTSHSPTLILYTHISWDPDQLSNKACDDSTTE